jgi:hypothetical protein
MTIPVSEAEAEKLYDSMTAIVEKVQADTAPLVVARNEALALSEKYRLAAGQHHEAICQVRQAAIAHLQGANWLYFKKHIGVLARMLGGK